MKPFFRRILTVIGIAVPITFFITGLPAWGRGALLGEILGFISYVWVGLSVRRFLSKGLPEVRRKLFLHTLLRYALIGGVMFLAVKAPAIHIAGVLIGYTIIQMPAAFFRALST
ncbi:ATP synthase subunit I [bacterium]|nr:ATP synthase subunit I [bacterium]